MRNRLRQWGMFVALAWVATAGASSPFIGAETTRPWSEVQAVVDSVDGARPLAGAMKFEGQGQMYYLAPGGRLAMISQLDDSLLETMREHDPEFDPETIPAMLGTWETSGAWLTVKTTGMAFRSDAARDAAMKRMMGEFETDSDEEFEDVGAELEESAAKTDVEAEAEAEAAEQEMPGMRLLRVPYRRGELLLAEMSLMWTAKAWDGQGPLRVTPVAWRLPAEDLARDADGDPEFEIANPLSANLPVELSGLLRRDAIEGRIVEVLDAPDALEWKQHAATVRVRLDRGANHGMYEGMDVYGLPPDEGFFAAVTELKGETSVAELHVSRFSPKHLPPMPTAGLRVTTRRAKGVGCAVDTSAAVRAKVLAVAQAKASLAWDDEGFAWVAMTVDQGTRHGLAAGDKLQGEIDELDGEGLVTAVEPERAEVLWRLQRYDEEQPVRLPAVGEALVTLAWKRAEWDTFGSAGLGAKH